MMDWIAVGLGRPVHVLGVYGTHHSMTVVCLQASHGAMALWSLRTRRT
jgi:hypothetical protein